MSIESGYGALQLWNNEAIMAAPVWLKAWLLGMGASFFAGVPLIFKHRGAAAVVGAFLFGLLFTKFLAPAIGFTVYSGLVALTHVALWPIGIYFLIRDVKDSKYYRVWSWHILAIMSLSLIFDVRDSFIYLEHIMISILESW